MDETQEDISWDEWSHFNWSDDADMEYVEAAFRAGYAAGMDHE